jgi:hypothetical protein
VLEILVDGKTGPIRGELEENTSWFAEIQGTKIESVDLRGDRNASLGDPGTPRLKRSIIGNAKSDMVDTTGSELRPRLIGAFLDHDQCSRTTRPDLEESGSCVRAFFLPKAKP